MQPCRCCHYTLLSQRSPSPPTCAHALRGLLHPVRTPPSPCPFEENLEPKQNGKSRNQIRWKCNKLLKNLWFGWRNDSGHCSAHARTLRPIKLLPWLHHDKFSLPQTLALPPHHHRASTMPLEVNWPHDKLQGGSPHLCFAWPWCQRTTTEGCRRCRRSEPQPCRRALASGHHRHERTAIGEYPPRATLVGRKIVKFHQRSPSFPIL
jgi:hypothetical protein